MNNLNIAYLFIVIPNGWYKIPDNITYAEPIKKPGLSAPNLNFSFTDNFEGTELGPQWRFFGEYNTDRFQVEDNSIAIKAKGDVIGNSSPLLYTPSDHSYMAEVELFIEGDAKGGFALFYNDRASSGMLADTKNIFANINSWQFPTEKIVLNGHVYLRLKNINHAVDLYYSTDAQDWIKDREFTGNIRVSSQYLWRVSRCAHRALFDW